MSTHKSKIPTETRRSCWKVFLCISANRCTDRCNGIEKMGIPDALALLNVKDARHLECLAWAVYDSTLLVGPRPKLLGAHTWCTVLAGLQRHIYRGRDDVAHCLPQTLGSWDHEKWVEALRHMGEDEHPGPRGGPGVARVDTPRHRRMRDNHGLHPPTCLQDVRMEQLYSPVRLRGVTVVLPCPMMSAPHPKWPQRSMFPPPHAQSSHSGEGMALASIKTRHWKTISKLSIHQSAT